jgi:hypothetical protein
MHFGHFFKGKNRGWDGGKNLLILSTSALSTSAGRTTTLLLSMPWQGVVGQHVKDSCRTMHLKTQCGQLSESLQKKKLLLAVENRSLVWSPI